MAATNALADTPAQAVSHSSFYLAMRILPRLQREAMFEVYSFCRAVDDIADDTAGSRSDRLNKLQSWRRDLAALYAGAHAAQFAWTRARRPRPSTFSGKTSSRSSTVWKWT